MVSEYSEREIESSVEYSQVIFGESKHRVSESKITLSVE